MIARLLRSSLLLLAGCGGSSTTDGAVLPDQSVPADLSSLPDLSLLRDLSSLPDLAGVCTTRTNPAPAVMINQVATAAPAAQGGPAVVDGTYYITAATFYTGMGGATGPNGVTLSGTNYVTGPAYEYINQASNAAKPSMSSGTFTQNGTKIAIQQTCPTATLSPFTDYDSDGTNVTIYALTTNPPQAITFTKQ